MAKVKTEQAFVGTRLVQRVITFSAKDGKFRCALPDFMVLSLGKTEVEAFTLEALILEWNEAARLVTEAATSKRKIIVHEIKYWASQGAHQDIGDRHHFTFNSGYCLTVAVGVYEESEIRLGDKTRFAYERLDSSLPYEIGPQLLRDGDKRAPNQVEWTQEREAWFLFLVNSLRQMILKVDAMFSTPERVLKAIDSGRMLMPGKGER